MNKFLKILFLLLTITLFSGESFSQTSNSKTVKYSRNTPSIITEIQRRQQLIQTRLALETDPVKRKELIRKQRQLNTLYYDPAVKQEVVKRLAPDFVKRSEAVNAANAAKLYHDDETQQATEDTPITLFSAYTKDWDSFPAEQKIKFCAQMKKECDTGKDLEYCRFVVVKCKSYMQDKDYQDLIKKYNKRP